MTYASTRLSLVITIILLLILAGVTISTLTGENGLLNRAEQAKLESEQAQIKEEIDLAKTELVMAYYLGEDVQEGEGLNEYVLRKLDGYTMQSGATLSKTEDGKYTYTDSKGNTTEVTIDSNLNVGVGEKEENQNPVIPTPPEKSEVEQAIEKQAALSTTENTTLTDAYGNKVVIPAGFKVTNDATTVDKGIVIEDVTNTQTLGSQFVWIPVPEDGYIYGENKTAINDIKLELNRYTFSEDGTAIPQGGNSIVNDGSSEYYHVELEISEYGNTTAKSISDFKTSVEENEGYYIGRYEARTVTSRLSNTTLTQITTKGSEYVYNYTTQIQAADLSRNMYTNKPFESDLMNSYAWDTATLFLQECGTNPTYSRKTSVNTYETGGLATAGTNNLETSDVECNVYDMASNVIEWTTETCINSSGPCTFRGGHFSYASSYTSVRHNPNSDSGIYIAFRPIIIL